MVNYLGGDGELANRLVNDSVRNFRGLLLREVILV